MYIGETGRRLGSHFREHLREVEKDDKDALKSRAGHLNPARHSNSHSFHLRPFFAQWGHRKSQK